MAQDVWYMGRLLVWYVRLIKHDEFLRLLLLSRYFFLLIIGSYAV